MSNLAIRQLFSPDVLKLDPSNKKKVLSFDEELWRLRVFDSIYKSILKVGSVREVILAVDAKDSWRKLYWTRYKSHRKSNREKLDFDWDNFYKLLDEYLEELQTFIPFKVIKAFKAEADDVIGVLALNKPVEFHIISTDKDFLQLHSSRVTIYNPLKQEVVRHPDPEMFLVEQCLIGQTKDNIYNIKTPLDWPEDKRKPGFGEAAFEKVMIYGWERWLEDNNLVERYNFNRNLMDFKKIPPTIVKRILQAYDGYQKCDIDNIKEFFKNHPWPDYTENWSNVEQNLMGVW